MKQKQLRKPLVVITGAASGIGLATAAKFIHAGYRVAALDRSEEGLQRLKRSKLGARVHPYRCDLNEILTLTPLARRIVSELGAPRVLVNNAGVWFYERIEESTDEHWQMSLNVNLVAAAALARGFVPAMKKVKGAAIVNVSSRNALSSSPKASSYDAAKAGLLGLTRTLAVELGPAGIRCNAVCPGVIDTPANKKELDDPEFVRNYLRLIPLNRFGTADDMANVIYFLASDEAAFVTGQYIVADGGQMCGQNYGRIFAA
jgi:meso-butanediol dehydrogenase/(S,S)-butanediol dehydrogenase/diacetyl reductase